MSTKVKLVSCIVGLIIAVGMLVVGVLAATSQDIFMQGNVNFVIGDRVLYVRDVQIQMAWKNHRLYQVSDKASSTASLCSA